MERFKLVENGKFPVYWDNEMFDYLIKDSTGRVIETTPSHTEAINIASAYEEDEDLLEF